MPPGDGLTAPAPSLDALRVVVDSLPVTMWTTDSDLRFTSALGDGFGPGHPKTLRELLQTDDPDHTAIAAHLGALEGLAFTYEIERDGRAYRSRVEPLRDDDGSIVGVVGVALDITERVDAEQRLRHALEELRATGRARVRLLDYLVRAQEQERKRIAQGIHDDSVQAMVSVGLRLEALLLAVEDEDLRRELAKLRTAVDGSVSRLRTLLFELAPSTLYERGLGAALQELLTRIAADAAAPLEYRVDDRLTEEPPARIRGLLFRMAQEPLANVRKHARATLVEVTLEARDEGFLVRVRDDGVGFTPEVAVGRPGHLGLAAMAERAEMAGGWFRIDSVPDAGTTVEFWLPAPSTA